MRATLAVAMQLTPGLQVNANVRLMRPLGKGGMGAVWVAQHLTLRTEVAVKFIDPQLAQRDPVMLTRFNREASTAAQIKSPHVVQMLDHGVMANQVPYIVMELLEGEGLDTRLKRQGRMAPQDLATLLAQVSKALSKAHSLGIVHRDLKPANLFLIESGYDLFAKVLDFGIAKANHVQEMSEVTSSLAIVGTPKYMSPEQLISTKDVTFSTDLWALAVIAYHALSGAVPYAGDTLPALTLAVCSGTFAPVTSLVPNLPATLDQWFNKAFQQEPSKRFASAEELASTFELALGGGPVVPLGGTALIPEGTYGASTPASHDTPAGYAGQTYGAAGHTGASYGGPASGHVAAAHPGAPQTLQATPSMALAAAQASAVGMPVSASTSSSMSAHVTTAGPGASSPWAKVAIAAIAGLTVVAVALVVLFALRDGGEPSSTVSSAGADSSGAPPPSVSAAAAASPSASASVSAAPVSASAAFATGSASASAVPSAPRIAPPVVMPRQPPPAAVRTNCSGDKAYYRDAHGRMKVRPECL